LPNYLFLLKIITLNKTKGIKKLPILNDPIYGFITIPNELVFRIIEHPYFQRLRRISQLGLSHLVYPGGLHTRFQHALGAMHLMGQAIRVLRDKNIVITNAEEEAVTIAILLHDIGHGPFSHTLEKSIVEEVNHEIISALFMDKLNKEFKGKLSLAIQIFRNKYKKKFLHQLVSSQLDMDRLDYLRRDSFFSGVSEGIISTDRIIKMLNVVNDELAVDFKGIYSIEKFIVARRLMYWQVYLHKAAIVADLILLNTLKRAKQLADKKIDVFVTPPLKMFIYNHIQRSDFEKRTEILETFAGLDDFDIAASIKAWTKHPDKILSHLSNCIINRKLFRIEIQNTPFETKKIKDTGNRIKTKYNLKPSELGYFLYSGHVTNNAYNPNNDRINILYRDGTVKDIAKAADLLNISVLSKDVKKYYLCYPKDVF
jgi:uncharacterized protein